MVLYRAVAEYSLKTYLSKLPIICQMSKTQKTVWSIQYKNSIKRELDIMKFRLYEVNFDYTCEAYPNYSETYFMNILMCFDDHHICGLETT